MQYRHYQRIADPVLVNAGSLPVQLDQWYPSSNWLRVDTARRFRPPNEYPFAVLYNPDAPVTVDQWLPVVYKVPRRPSPRPWQMMTPMMFDPSVIVPPSTPAGKPTVFLAMDEVDVIQLAMNESVQTVYLSMDEGPTVYLEMSE